MPASGRELFDRLRTQLGFVTWDRVDPTGGTVYNQALVAELRSGGIDVRLHALAGPWPAGDAISHDSAGAGVAPGACVIGRRDRGLRRARCSCRRCRRWPPDHHRAAPADQRRTRPRAEATRPLHRARSSGSGGGIGGPVPKPLVCRRGQPSIRAPRRWRRGSRGYSSSRGARQSAHRPATYPHPRLADSHQGSAQPRPSTGSSLRPGLDSRP